MTCEATDEGSITIDTLSGLPVLGNRIHPPPVALAGRCGDAPAYGRVEAFGLAGAQRSEPEGPSGSVTFEAFSDALAQCGVGDSAPPFLDTLQTSGEHGSKVDEVEGYGPGPFGATCGRWMFLGCQSCGERRGWVYKPCGDRFACRACRKRWGVDTRRRFWPVLQFFQRQRRVRFITLTVKNGPDLKERLDHLRDSMRKLSQRVFWRNAVRMGVRVLEVTWGRDGWHAHFHILAVGDFLPFAELQAAWKEITGDSYIVNVKSADPATVSRELFKYTLKDAGIPSARMDEAKKCLAGRRCVELIGANVKVRKWLRARVLRREKLKCKCCGGSGWVDFSRGINFWSAVGGVGPASPPAASVLRVVQGFLFETGRLL